VLPNNILALVVTFGLALAWLRLCDYLAHKGWISSWLSRKIIHIGTGPIFVASWLFFQDTPAARYLAALVPLAITVQFALVGLGVIKDPSAVTAMSRTGDRREVLKGPLLYGIAFIALTIIYWKDSPTGIIALMLLCGGDGLAEVVGKRFGKTPLPWSRRKSWAGFLAMFAGGWVFSLLMLWIYLFAGIFAGSLASYIPAVSVIALAGMIVESLPMEDVDNLTIPITAAVLGSFLF
jgi:phytol kinase